MHRRAAPLTTALADASPIVRGRAAEALGLIGSTTGRRSRGARRGRSDRPDGRRVRAVRGRPRRCSQTTRRGRRRRRRRRSGSGIYALVRLHAYEPLAAAVLDNGVAGDDLVAGRLCARPHRGPARASRRCCSCSPSQGKYSVGVCRARPRRDQGRGGGRAAERARFKRPRRRSRCMVSAIRALAAIGDARGRRAARRSSRRIRRPTRTSGSRSVTALGALKAADGLPIVQDLLSDPWPTMRAAALRAAAAIDPESFVLVLSSMEPDPQWIVRAALADVLATLPAEVALGARALDAARRGQAGASVPCSARCAHFKAPDAATIALAQLKEPDFAVRAAAAQIDRRAEAGRRRRGAPRRAYTLAQGGRRDRRARGDPRRRWPSTARPRRRRRCKEALARQGLGGAACTRPPLLAKLDPSGDYRAAIRPAPGAPIAPLRRSAAHRAGILAARVHRDGEGHDRVRAGGARRAADRAATSSRSRARGSSTACRSTASCPNFVVQDGDPRGDGEGGPGLHAFATS